MEISIIINNYKTRGLLKQCLKGIYAFPPSSEFEVVVVDNYSGDGSVELVREMFPQVNPVGLDAAAASGAKDLAEKKYTIENLSNGVKLIASKENLGHHKGNNLGIKNSSGKYVLIMNSDIALFDDAIDKMHRFMESHPEAALVGPRLKNPDGTIQNSCMRFPHLFTPFYRRTFLSRFDFAKKELASYLMSDFDHQSTRTVDWILGACEMVRRSAIEQVGGMDEYLYLYFGDVAWCKKFWSAKMPVFYLAEGEIIHYHKRESAESGIFSRVFWIHIIDWGKYLMKYYK